MNKRIKKKFIKKFKVKYYINSRRNKILSSLKLNNINLDSSKLNIIHIIDSNKMDLKHPKKISILYNCVPVKISN